MDDLVAIIPFLGRTEDFLAWNGLPEMDWETYQRTHGQVEQAVYWFHVIAPEFVESRGMVLRQKQVPIEASGPSTPI